MAKETKEKTDKIEKLPKIKKEVSKKDTSDNNNLWETENSEIYDDIQKDKTFEISNPDSVDYNKITDWLSFGSFILDAKITNCYRDKEGILRTGIAAGMICNIAGENSCVTEDTMVDVVVE